MANMADMANMAAYLSRFLRSSRSCLLAYQFLFPEERIRKGTERGLGMLIIHTREFQNITIMARIWQKINLYKICAGLCLFDTPHWPAWTSAFLTGGRSTRYLFEQHLMRIIFISCQTCFLGVESCIALNIS